METPASPGFGPWLKTFHDPARRERIWQLGLLTGLRAEADGKFRPANFERGLVLDRLVELRQPRTVLELGTGRGLGAFALASAARAYGVDIRIDTVDLTPPAQPIDYAIEVNGAQKQLRASCEEIWKAHLDPALAARITTHTGFTTAILPQLAKAGRQFDLIFIDAGHDLFSVAHDVSYAAAMLAPGGAMLLDDFAPLEDFGIGTCIVHSHLRRLFEKVEVFPTEGLVYGGAVFPEAPRGMIFLEGSRLRDRRVRRGRLAFWKIAGAVLDRCHAPSLFPLRAD